MAAAVFLHRPWEIIKVELLFQKLIGRWLDHYSNQFSYQRCPKRSKSAVSGELCFFWSLTWHSMASQILLKFDASHNAWIVLLVFGVTKVSFQSHGCDCWSCKSEVPQLFFQAVLVIWPFVAQISTTPGGCATLATLLQMHFKPCHDPPWSEKKIVLYTWRFLMFGWIEFEFRTVHHSMSCAIPLQFVKVLCWLDQWFPQQFCAKLPCVVPPWRFPCFPWRMQLGEVPWPYLTCPMRTATAWSPAGISIHWSGGYRSEDNDADDGFWNLVLESVNGYERELVHVPAFLSIHLFFGRAEVQRSRSCHCGANGGSSFDVNTEILLQEDCPIRLSCGLAWFVLLCGVVKW